VKKAGLRLAALLSAAVVGAWSADYIADYAPSYFRTNPATPVAGADGTLELKWDNGTHRWDIAGYTGSDSWVGNDFDISTISGYHAIHAIKLQSRMDGPNGRWDGFPIGLFDFTANAPGSQLRGPKYFKPERTNYERACIINRGFTFIT
jgi:hypothetical protein